MKRNLIIIAKAVQLTDMEFYNSVLRIDSFLTRKAIVIMFPTVSQFVDFLETVPESYSFSLLVHVGTKGMNATDDGKQIRDALEALPYAQKIKFEFTTRDGDRQFEGKRAHHTQKLGNETFDINDLQVNYVKDFREIKLADSKPKLDFAVLTALDDDENDIFKNNMDPATKRPIGFNTISGQFLKNEDLANDYCEPFILAKQKQMGMVDAALSAAEIIHNYSPDYLIMGGVCGGRKSKVKLFDLIIPAKAYDFSYGTYHNGIFSPRDQDAKVDPALIGYLSTNKKRIKSGMMALLDGNNKEYEHHIGAVNFHFEVMACGPRVIKSDGFLEGLSTEINDSIRGLEMESYSIARVHEFHDHKVNTLIVKSVMDYTDSKKDDDVAGLPVKKIAGLVSYLAVRAIMPLIKEFDIKKSNLNH